MAKSKQCEEIPVRQKAMVRLHPLLLQQIKQLAQERGTTDNWVLERTVSLGLSVILEEEA